MLFRPLWGLEAEISQWKPDDGLKNAVSRANMADYADSLLCFDCMNNEIRQKVSGPVSEPFHITMDFGLHELRFMGHSSKDWQVDDASGVFSTSKVTETFLKRMSLSIDENTDENLSVRMDRVVTKLTLLIEDAIPAGVNQMELTVGGHLAKLDMGTGLGVAEEKGNFTVAWDIDKKYHGTRGLKLTVFSFCEEGEFDVSLRVVARGADGKIIADRTAEGIPLMMNRCTVAKGRIFSIDGGVTFSEPGEWLPQIEIEI